MLRFSLMSCRQLRTVTLDSLHSCKRKMQGHWVNDRAHYRCRYPAEYAASKRLEHPLNVYLREDLVCRR